MFRTMKRYKQQMEPSDCIKLLKQAPRGVLSMIGDDGYPYGIPMNHWYCEADGNLYFHGAKTGHKIDAITACEKVSYCVHDEGYREPGEWPLHIKSVVVFGRMQPVTDPEKCWKSARIFVASLRRTPLIWNMNCVIPDRMCSAWF